MDQSGKSEFLPGFWYAALPSEELRRKGMRRQRLFGLPLLFVRDGSGAVHALDDHCPHRGIPLSDGSFDGWEIECCYHGWRFSCSGQCTAIPSLTPDSSVNPGRIKVRTYESAESDGLIWIYKRKSKEPLPPVPFLEKPSENYTLQVLSRTMRCEMDHGIIGLMDPAHGPFVHQAWWWRTGKSIHEKEKRFEPIDYGFRMSAHNPSSNSAAYKLLKIYGEPITTTIDFVLPNRRIEKIRSGKFWYSSLAVVTPVDELETRLDFVAAWNVFRGVPFLKSIQRYFGSKFIDQDKRIMEKQAAGLRDRPNLMLIDGADTPAKWYFQLKNAYQKSVEEGTEFENPIHEPVTLRWRS
ncbi:MAG: aromatic ring-hydroxylating dioxygenase subunit alpha [Acidobacteria bacterium]|nr:MAG: aromatic ring-hydroxylating dioxygenase subunit alpha [Acidobacteriota bacterium]REK04160.1 MAG: aromatic ring-hydroxylating dioxygenase subunit alpha [Acidobacteriota bacterium]REK15322.1 MAG: aromatic ring-hydroxylating dioxygenase subunit alpha [Acidobacteriota bacterium]REK46412.1 MAG: aromatic ring-hydroxylating dioxygenase subunit alpha [Acidobacteriota bacterium]